MPVDRGRSSASASTGSLELQSGICKPKRSCGTSISMLERLRIVTLRCQAVAEIVQHSCVLPLELAHLSLLLLRVKRATCNRNHAAQHSTAQQSIAQHSTAQHSTAQRGAHGNRRTAQRATSHTPCTVFLLRVPRYQRRFKNAYSHSGRSLGSGGEPQAGACAPEAACAPAGMATARTTGTRSHSRVPCSAQECPSIPANETAVLCVRRALMAELSDTRDRFSRSPEPAPTRG